jgi:hypothetical protein
MNFSTHIWPRFTAGLSKRCYADSLSRQGPRCAKARFPQAKATLIISVWQVFAASSALATSLPLPALPDPTAFCRAMKNDIAVNECLRMAQEGYEAAKFYWPELSDYAARLCVHSVTLGADGRPLPFARISPWAWASLGQCVTQAHFDYDAPRQAQPNFHAD